MTTSTRSQAIDGVLAEAVASGAVPLVVAVAADRDGIVYEGAGGPRAPGEDGSVDIAGVAGAFYTQILPFLAPEATRMYADFETALYASL